MLDELEITALEADDTFYRYIDKNIWLMDDHRWSYKIWNDYREQSGIDCFKLVHADYHWDGVNDFYERPKLEEEFLKANPEQIEKIVSENKLIKCDSFIAPAILKGFIGEIHFFCFQFEGTDIGIDEELLKRKKCKQFIYKDSKEFLDNKITPPVIFDLCLDLFNRPEKRHEGNIWTCAEINEFFHHMEEIIQIANIITVSMSFGFSGEVKDTHRLTSIALQKLCEMRK